MSTTSIEWCDKTWNPVRGCARVSEGCVNCYAERQAYRFSGPGQPYQGLVQMASQGPKGTKRPKWTGQIVCDHAKLEEPLHWKKPCMVFVNSMSDLFHEQIPHTFLAACFTTMAGCPQHTFQILTKRPEHMVQVMPLIWGIVNDDKPLENVWLGVSVENQKAADQRIPLLLKTPAAVRWLSVEPQLELIKLPFCDPACPHPHMDAIDDVQREDPEGVWGCLMCNGYVRFIPNGIYRKVIPAIDWVVCGGESGPGARPFNLAWAESLLAQCRAAGVPFFLKQIGSNSFWMSDERLKAIAANGSDGFTRQSVRNPKGGDPAEWPEHLRVREWPNRVEVPA